LKEINDKFKYILIVIDAFTKFVWLFASKSTGADEIINYLTLLFNLIDNPKRIINDRRTAFSSNNFVKFVKDKTIKYLMAVVVFLGI